LAGQTHFNLVYGKVAFIPLHFFSNSNRIAIMAKFDQDRSINDQLYQFNKLEEERVIAMHHQEVKKQHYKAWHDRHLKKKNIKNGDLVLLYAN